MVLLTIIVLFLSVRGFCQRDTIEHQYAYSTDGPFVMPTMNRDTLYLVKSDISDLILYVWNMPSYRNKQPVFIYVTRETMRQMIMARKSKSKINN